MTCLCYLKIPSQKFKILPWKQAQVMYVSLQVVLFQISMMLCLGYALFVDENKEFDHVFPNSMALFYVKLPCCIALHYSIQPFIQKGMSIMKFANNQCDQFVEGGSEMSFLIGLLEVLISLIAEYLNILILTY